MKQFIQFLIKAGLLMFFTLTVNASETIIDDPLWQEVPTVITPARLKQSMRDVPASITVITAEMIRDLDIRTYPEALRLVPGMTVHNIAGNFPVAQYHGTNIAAPRRMQVLVDGISVYRTGKAEMDWTQIPASLEDVDRIEVVRGPNAASYGSNSTVAVVNIITRHPEESLGWQTKVRAGSLNTSDQYFRHGGTFGKHNYRISYSRSSDDGFDLNAAGEERRDSSDIQRLNFNSVFDLGDKDALEFAVGLVDGENQEEFIDSSQISFPDIELENNFLQLKWQHDFSDRHELIIRAHTLNEIREQYWNSCLPQVMFTSELRQMHIANPSYATTILSGGIPSGGTAEDDILAAAVFARVASLGGVAGALSPVCGMTNQNLDLLKNDFEIQDTYVFNDSSRLVFGAGVSDSKITSETFFTGGPFDVRAIRLFASYEHRFSERFLINAGVLFEDEDILDDTETSPRFALHYSPNEHHTIKFVYSKAVRTPDIFEVNPDWNYRFRNLTPPVQGESEALFYFTTLGPFPELEPEEVVSNEIIWYANLPDLRLEFEIKLFREELSNLISEKLQFFDFNPTNNSDAGIEGFEAEISFKPTRRLTTRLAYSYQDLNTSDFFETTFHTTHSGSITLGYQFDNQYRLNTAYFANTQIQGFDYHRFDIALAKTFNLRKGQLRGSLLYRYIPEDQGGALLDINSTIENDYDDSNHFYLTLDYTF